jgi:hypothetical protein
VYRRETSYRQRDPETHGLRGEHPRDRPKALRLHVYKQILIGARKIKTKYIACIEDDSLYTAQHFTWEPPDDTFWYNMNRCRVHNEKFLFKHHTVVTNAGMWNCISPTELMVKTLEARFEKFPVMGSQISWGEPGRHEHRLGLPSVKYDRVINDIPNLTFEAREGLGGIRRIHPDDILKDELPYWGKAKDAAYRFRQEMKARLDLPGTVGVAGNKMVSSIASRIMPSEGVLDVDHGKEPSFMAPLRVDLLPGIGPVRKRLLLEELKKITKIPIGPEQAVQQRKELEVLNSWRDTMREIVIVSVKTFRQNWAEQMEFTPRQVRRIVQMPIEIPQDETLRSGTLRLPPAVIVLPAQAVEVVSARDVAPALARERDPASALEVAEEWGEVQVVGLGAAGLAGVAVLVAADFTFFMTEDSDPRLWAMPRNMLA